VAIGAAAPADQEEGARTGNILLRHYFLERYFELHGDRTVFPATVPPEERLGRRSSDPMAERFVNIQVDQFLTELEQKLTAMKSTVRELEAVRQDAVSDHATDDASTRARMRQLAEDMGNRAEDLFDMVALVVVDLRAKNDVRPPSSSDAEFFGKEVGFLRKQVGKAEGRIKALFLQPTHTVDLEELRGDNVLTELKSIEEVSKDIKKKAVNLPDHSDKAE